MMKMKKKVSAIRCMDLDPNVVCLHDDDAINNNNSNVYRIVSTTGFSYGKFHFELYTNEETIDEKENTPKI